MSKALKTKWQLDCDQDTHRALKEMSAVTNVPMKVLLRQMVITMAEHFSSVRKELKAIRAKESKPIKLK